MQTLEYNDSIAGFTSSSMRLGSANNLERWHLDVPELWEVCDQDSSGSSENDSSESDSGVETDRKDEHTDHGKIGRPLSAGRIRRPLHLRFGCVKKAKEDLPPVASPPSWPPRSHTPVDPEPETRPVHVIDAAMFQSCTLWVHSDHDWLIYGRVHSQGDTVADLQSRWR
jgi:hypothetical protein